MNALQGIVFSDMSKLILFKKYIKKRIARPQRPHNYIQSTPDMKLNLRQKKKCYSREECYIKGYSTLGLFKKSVISRRLLYQRGVISGVNCTYNINT